MTTLGPTDKIVLAMTKALEFKRTRLTPWEVTFLSNLVQQHERTSQALSVKQKNLAFTILKRVEIDLNP